MWKRESQKYLFGWILCFVRTLQNKKMSKKGLNKNKKLHWGNKFEVMFGPLSLGALVFKRAQGKCFCLASNFWHRKLEAK